MCVCAWVFVSVSTCVCASVGVGVWYIMCVWWMSHVTHTDLDNVSTSSRLLKIIGLFCKRAYERDDILQKRPILLRAKVIRPLSISITSGTGRTVWRWRTSPCPIVNDQCSFLRENRSICAWSYGSHSFPIALSDGNCGWNVILPLTSCIRPGRITGTYETSFVKGSVILPFCVHVYTYTYLHTVPRSLLSRIWSSAEEYAVLILFSNPVGFSFSNDYSMWFVLATYQHSKCISAGPALNICTSFMREGGRGYWDSLLETVQEAVIIAATRVHRWVQHVWQKNHSLSVCIWF